MSLNVQGNNTNHQIDFNTYLQTDETQKNNPLGTTTINLIIQFNQSVDEVLMNKLLDMDVPGNKPGGGEVNGAISRFDGMSKAMTDIFQLMELMHHLANEQRKGAREARQADRDLQFSQLQGAADKIREAANHALASAIVTGVFSMAQGALSIGSGAAGIHMLNQAKGSSTVDLDVQKVTNMGRIFDGIGSVTQGTGKMISGSMDWRASNAQADQKLLEAEAQKSETRAQSESDFMQNLQDLIKDMQNKLQAIQQSNAEAFSKASAA